MYKAFTSVFMAKSWSLGAIFWQWEMDAIDASGFTPQGKAAEKVLQNVFAKYC